MVAITVILAAVIGTFVLGLGDQVQSSAPNANFQFEYEDVIYEGSGGDITVTAVTVTHNGGQDVDPDNVAIEVGGNPGYNLVDNGGDAGELDTAEAIYDGTSTIATGTSTRVVFVDTNPSGGTNYPSNDPGTSSGSFSGDADGLTGGETVRVIWTSPNGDSSNTIGSSTVPN
jgi:FlaG/FlaF family flagellin (archaellin)